MNFTKLFLTLVLVGALLSLGCSTAGNGLAKNEQATGSGSGSEAPQAIIESPTRATEDATQVKIGNINWYVNYDEALQVAKQKNKPIWLHFGENPG